MKRQVSFHFGGRLGRATTDSIHLLIKTVKDAWRKGEVASLLCLDVKAAFPSAAVDVLLLEMKRCGIPMGHMEWFKSRLEGRKTSLLFDDYKSNTFNIKEGIDQGDARFLITWIIYNHQILKIFKKVNKETSFLFMDDTVILVTGPDFTAMHMRLKVLSCNATWKMIDRVYPELKSEQDEYRFKVEL